VKLTKLAQAISLICIATPVFAQAPRERIEITGSNIRRVYEEGALPVQIISRRDIERRGITNAEELVMLLSANGTGADNLSSNVGIQLGTTDRNNNGNSSANLRGLGASSTLVLLNGRRLATHGAKGNAVDLNSIPLAAIERVEILKDGASAIYGTDAIGGVINFILRKDFTGVELTGSADMTEEGGGNLYRGSLLAGWGDLSKNRWNVMGMITYDKQERLSGFERSFANGFQPDRGLSPDTAGAPFASQTGLAGTAIGATFTTPNLGTGTQTFNRANLLSFLGQCDSIENMSQYQFDLWGARGARYACAYDYGGAEVLIQAVERTQGVGRATFKIGNEHTAFLELIATKTKAEKAFEEYQITTTGSFAGMQYPVNGPFYQDLSAYIPSFDRTRPIAYRWRCMECGLRTIETETDAYRFLAGAEGTFGGRWDYKIAAGQAGSKAESLLASGFMYTAPLTAALAGGLVNPWLMPGQTQTPAAMALLDGARADGTRLFAGESEITTVDGAVSGELFNLPAGPVAAAIGFDYRRESYQFDDGSRTSQPVYQAPFDPQFPEVRRTVKAVYGEVAVPIVRNLEATLAVRHDDYSDFGTTTNPKISVKWNPTNALMFRGSYNEGFRAPSFFQLYTTTTESPVPGNIADPVLCPGGNVPGADLSVCAIRPDSQQGGNPDLQPETSKQWSIGLVFQPTPWMSGSIDLWQIRRQDLVYELTPQQVIANFTTFPNSFVRGANGRLDDPGGYIRAGFVNAEGDITKGVDVNLRFNGRVAGGRWIANLDGTYIDSHRSRIFEDDDYVEFVGQWNSRDLFVRWKHTASLAYETGPWAVTLFQQYTKGYKDEVPAGTVPPGFNPNVDDYWLHHVMVAYTGLRNLTLTFGVKNIFDEDPPFTAHNLDFTPGAGWDPRVADPRGRSYVFRATYRF